MATYKRINGNYNITTLNSGGAIALNTSNVLVSGNISSAGNIAAGTVTAGFFFGDGRFLSNVNVANASVTSTNIANGTSNVSIPVASGNITFGVNSTGNVIVVSTLGANITTGTASTSNITGALRVTGGVGVAGNIYADAMFSNNSVVLTANSTIDGGTY
jgi:hypothetical protein